MICWAAISGLRIRSKSNRRHVKQLSIVFKISSRPSSNSASSLTSPMQSFGSSWSSALNTTSSGCRLQVLFSQSSFRPFCRPHWWSWCQSTGITLQASRSASLMKIYWPCLAMPSCISRFLSCSSGWPLAAPHLLSIRMTTVKSSDTAQEPFLKTLTRGLQMAQLLHHSKSK